MKGKILSFLHRTLGAWLHSAASLKDAFHKVYFEFHFIGELIHYLQKSPVKLKKI